MKSEELRVCDAYYINSLSPTDSSPGGGALTENKNFCRKFAVIFASLSREVDFDEVKRRRDLSVFAKQYNRVQVKPTRNYSFFIINFLFNFTCLTGNRMVTR